VINEDNKLGMNRAISRRDFLNGVAMATGASLLPHSSWAEHAGLGSSDAESYPPARLGMRGSHPGAFEVAHNLRDRRQLDLSGAEDTHEHYDLIVVGGGLSGLSAAYYYIKDVGRQCKILILDNHDDFGGHAKRNEMEYHGQLLVAAGGTQELEALPRYNQWARQILDDIGIDVPRYKQQNKFQEGLYQSLGLRTSRFFDKQTFGVDRLILGPKASRGDTGLPPPLYTVDSVRAMPISDSAKKDLLRLEDPHQPDYMPGLTSAQKKAKLARMSFKDYLLNVAKVDSQAYWFYMALGRDVFCVGGDAMPALFAWQMGEVNGGFSGLKLDPSPEGLLANLPGPQHGRQAESDEPVVHYPDGNATVARLLARWLIPEAVPGTCQDDVGAGRVHYNRLDLASNATRIRLNSTVLNVRHDGEAGSAREVVATYNTGGKLHSVRGSACVMACWNMFIPYLVPDLPAVQKEALAFNVKGPIVCTNVFLRNWRPFQKLGTSYVQCPTMYHDSIALIDPANLGALRHARNPEEPIVVRMTRTPGSPGLPRKDQHRVGRADLLATSFETFERNIRQQLTRVLERGGFDAANDIVGIAVNRWPHGYSYTYSSLYDPMEWVFTETDDRPCVKARQPFGLISIANADAAASPHTDAAFQEAHRAVTEILDRRNAASLSGND
jgi:spermidine dehydrogenase